MWMTVFIAVGTVTGIALLAGLGGRVAARHRPAQ
jgi:hypothetical protein